MLSRIINKLSFTVKYWGTTVSILQKSIWWEHLARSYLFTNSSDTAINSTDLLSTVRGVLSDDLDAFQNYITNNITLSAIGTDRINITLLNDANNYATGAEGRDYMEGRLGDDVMFGDEGSDIFAGFHGTNLFIGQNTAPTTPEHDIVSYLAATSGIVASLSHDVGLIENNANADYDVTIYIDDLIGSDFADVITSTNTRGSFIFAGLGNDTATTGSGNDTVDTGSGTDTINTGAGDDTILAGPGQNTITLGTGADRVILHHSTLSDSINNTVTITDFSANDILDISNLLVRSANSNIQDLISLQSNGTDTIVLLDRDGTSNDLPEAIATLQNFDASNFSLSDNLITSAQNILYAPALGQSNGKGLSSSGADGISGITTLDAGLLNYTNFDLVETIPRDPDTHQPLTIAVGGTTVDGNLNAASGYAPNRVWWYPDDNEPGDVLLRATDMLAQQLTTLRTKGVVTPAFIWAQGEAEARYLGIATDQTAAMERYKSAVLSVFTYMRDRLGEDIDFFIAKSGRFNVEAALNAGETSESIAAAQQGLLMLRQAQQELIDDYDFIHFGADYIDLPMLYETDPVNYPYDVWHLGYDAREIFGQRLSENIATVVNSKPYTPTPPTNSQLILGTTGEDVLNGTIYGNTLNALSGDDLINVSGGDNIIAGGTGNDSIRLGGDHDVIIVEADLNNILENADYIRGFQAGANGDALDVTALLQAAGYYGTDPIADGIINIEERTSSLVLRLDLTRSGSGGAYINQIANVTAAEFSSDHNLIFDRNASPPPPENVTGTLGDDYLKGSIGGGTINGLAGSDRIETISGSYVITAGEGKDTIVLSSGQESIVFESDLENITNNADYISGFQTGQSGDVIDLTNLLHAADYYGDNPVTDGYLLLAQENLNLALRFDVDGMGPKSSIYLGQLANVNASDFSVDYNLIFDRDAQLPPPVSFIGTNSIDHISGSVAGGAIFTQAGDDVINGTGGDTRIKGGVGRDKIYLGIGHDVVVLEDDVKALTKNSDYIAHFQSGVGGDQIDITDLLQEVGYAGVDPIADGYLVVTLNADRVVLRFDVDGHGTAHKDYYLSQLADTDSSAFSLDHNVIFTTAGYNSETVTGTNDSDALIGADGGGTIKGLAGDDIITADRGATTLIGGEGHDTLYAGTGIDTIVLEDDLSNLLANADIVHNFDAGVNGDIVDLSDVLSTVGYTGSDPIADGLVNLQENSGSTEVYFDADGSGSLPEVLVLTITNVAPATLDEAHNFIF